LLAGQKGYTHDSELTKLAKHIRDITSADIAIAIPVQYLKALAQFPHLSRL
jgi:hypothetical protein